jgi:hypothetical protein
MMERFRRGCAGSASQAGTRKSKTFMSGSVSCGAGSGASNNSERGRRCPARLDEPCVMALTRPILTPAVLRVALTSTNTQLLVWPAALTGFELEQNTDLATPNWTVVTNLPVEVGDEMQVIAPPTAAQNFYRLHNL